MSIVSFSQKYLPKIFTKRKDAMAQLLQEYVDSRGVAMRVDREVGILRGVKLIGLESRNGRRYRESALAAAATLYEEAKVNVNHPKEGPLTPRDYQDRLGVIRGVELRAGEGLFGDLHFNPKHALAEQLLWDAEHNPQNVGFSHNVLARLSLEDETAVVEEITRVQSVDLVADPATTQGLFEQASEKVNATKESETFEKKPAWDALTLDVLRLHRPDLLAEIQAIEAAELQQQLDEAETLSASLQRKQRVYELLCENQLTVSSEESPAEKASDIETAPQSVSSMFVELLMQVADEDQLEVLVVERAELTHAVSRKAKCSLPYSREQTLALGSRQVAPGQCRRLCRDVKDFRRLVFWPEFG